MVSSDSITEEKTNPEKLSYEEVIDEQNKKQEDYNKLLGEETQLELTLINEDNIPDDIPQKVMDIFIEYNLIK